MNTALDYWHDCASTRNAFFSLHKPIHTVTHGVLLVLTVSNWYVVSSTWKGMLSCKFIKYLHWKSRYYIIFKHGHDHEHTSFISLVKEPGAHDNTPAYVCALNCTAKWQQVKYNREQALFATATAQSNEWNFGFKLWGTDEIRPLFLNDLFTDLLTGSNKKTRDSYMIQPEMFTSETRDIRNLRLTPRRVLFIVHLFLFFLVF